MMKYRQELAGLFLLFVYCTVALAQSYPPPNAWGQIAHDSANSGRSSFGLISAPSLKLRHYSRQTLSSDFEFVVGAVQSPAQMSGDARANNYTAYAFSKQSRLQAIAQDGEQLWISEDNVTSCAIGAYGDPANAIYCWNTNSSTIVAMDLTADGRVLWRVQLPDAELIQATIASDVYTSLMYVLSLPRNNPHNIVMLQGISLLDGSQLWNVTPGNWLTPSGAAHAASMVIVPRDRSLFMTTNGDGYTIWNTGGASLYVNETAPCSPNLARPVYIEDNDWICYPTTRGISDCIIASNGTYVKSIGQDSQILAPRSLDALVFVGVNYPKKNLTAYNTTTGAVIWTSNNCIGGILDKDNNVISKCILMQDENQAYQHICAFKITDGSVVKCWPSPTEIDNGNANNFASALIPDGVFANCGRYLCLYKEDKEEDSNLTRIIIISVGVGIGVIVLGAIFLASLALFCRWIHRRRLHYMEYTRL